MARHWWDWTREWVRPPAPTDLGQSRGNPARRALGWMRRLPLVPKAVMFALLAMAMAAISFERPRGSRLAALGFHVALVALIVGAWSRGIAWRRGWAGRILRVVVAGTLLLPAWGFVWEWMSGGRPMPSVPDPAALWIMGGFSLLLGGGPALMVALLAEKREVRGGLGRWVLRGASSAIAGMVLVVIGILVSWSSPLSGYFGWPDWDGPFQLAWAMLVGSPGFGVLILSIPVVLGLALGIDLRRRAGGPPASLAPPPSPSPASPVPGSETTGPLDFALPGVV
jgi:hypothetical protein